MVFPASTGFEAGAGAEGGGVAGGGPGYVELSVGGVEVPGLFASVPG